MSKVQLITSQLGTHLLKQIDSASSICILTSFVMKSGVQYLRQALKAAAERGAEIKVCTGDYLFVTQPEALRMLLEIDSRIEVRLWKSNGVSFHPKAYLFQKENQDSLFVGSSNLSHSALSNGVEWSLSVSDDEAVFSQGLHLFLETFYSDQTIPLNQETWKNYEESYEKFHITNPNLPQKWTETEEMDLMLPSEGDEESIPTTEIIHESSVPYGKISPRFAQLEALEELNKTMEEDYAKALVVMATGLGKTYLAGFFARNFKRVLFIAHLEEILYQAKKSFQTVMPEERFSIYNGKVKESHGHTIFASIYTLSMQRHLRVFDPDEFDLIIVDEFHHAAAESYQRVLDYFKPKFLLGITATPDRNDNKDVYAICDGNVAFRIDFLEAIQRNWLAPFKYFGVYDDTDYSQITWLGNRYDEQELLQLQLRDEMAEKVLIAWKDKRKTRTIGFCSSIKQADFLSEFFKQNGFSAISLHSKQKDLNRDEAIKQLADGALDIIFTVNLFNEGVDIPAVDTLLFVRPTESLTVFTQQIGRGLRLHDSKDHCVIIDLIGNYRNADVKLSLFDTDLNRKAKAIELVVPELCDIQLDIQVINLLKEMGKKKQPRRAKLVNDYHILKQELGRRPTYLELHLKGASDSPQYRQEFSSYYGFLEYAKELSEHESEIFHRYEQWLLEVEKTGMTKSYKLVVLLAMLERGEDSWFKPITSKEAAPFFHSYLTEVEYRKQIDFADKTTKKLWDYNEAGVSKLISTMPMTKWSGSSKGLISYDDDIFKLNFVVRSKDQRILFNMTKDICEYRLHYHFERKAK
ncbi:DEAD/DEAH box helicase family protein [Peribacillus muralis]|uniref:DEAD/DEAH box helicase family protein n=1 Tax=Peribacillus muralis TaxID=264697 RepID=UPI001F4D5F7A|nr:DEAD/DEAH box helicase family protein [Peribacillus muralis]MCK1992166.1 DEAD/DEAH box helicase family protein [Peribacillus muralis]MCK2012722.1 DEAD/DEAH box helicase family protein [Peribacillus muralis]